MAIDINEGIKDQFETQRKRAAQQEAANLQNRRDVMARRAAAMGGPGGAFLKQDQIAADESAQRLQQANESIDTAQNAELRRIREVQQGQEFARGERLGSQEFQAGQNAIQQRLAEAGLTGKYNGEDTFAAKQAAIQNRLAEKQGAMAEAGLTGTYNGANTLAKTASDSALQQQKFENEQNLKTNQINALNALKSAGYSYDQMKGIFESLGYSMPYDAPAPSQPSIIQPIYNTNTNSPKYGYANYAQNISSYLENQKKK